MSTEPKPAFFVIHDTVEANGKTIRENNLERQHAIPIGTLVEILPDEDDDPEDDHKAGMRLRIAGHHRDCDGTPLYSLGWQQYRGEREGTVWNSVLHGFSDESLKPVV